MTRMPRSSTRAAGRRPSPTSGSCRSRNSRRDLGSGFRNGGSGRHFHVASRSKLLSCALNKPAMKNFKYDQPIENSQKYHVTKKQRAKRNKHKKIGLEIRLTDTKVLN